MRELTPEIIRDKDRRYSIFLIAVLIIAVLVYFGFSSNPGMEGLEKEVHRSGENPAIIITGPIYVLASVGNALAAFFLGVVPAVCSAVSLVLGKLAVFFGIRRNGSVNKFGYYFFKVPSVFLISAYFIIISISIFML